MNCTTSHPSPQHSDQSAGDVTVDTQVRLYQGATLELPGGLIRRVVREGASSWRADRGFRTHVTLEPTILEVGVWVIAATVVEVAS